MEMKMKNFGSLEESQGSAGVCGFQTPGCHVLEIAPLRVVQSILD